MIFETRDKPLLRRILARDPIGAIYLLGDLEERAFRDCRWLVDDDRGLVLIYSGLSVPVVLPFGEAAGLMARPDLPERFYTKLTGAQRPLCDRWSLTDPQELYVMGLEELRPAAEVPGLAIRRVVEATPIAGLYDDYPGNYFSPEQVPAGFYLAAEMDGQVVAAAGTHAWAPAEGAAAIGNVVTAASWRGRGIARALVERLCRELIARGCRHIGLHVERGNTAAVRCYRALGFAIHSETTQWTAGPRTQELAEKSR